MEIQGKVKGLGNLLEGEGANGQWIKQEFIIETMEQYPKTVCVTCWGDRALAVQNLNAGDVVKLGINIESREYNGKWYTDVKAYSIARMSQEYIKAAQPFDNDFFGDNPDDLPFN